MSPSAALWLINLFGIENRAAVCQASLRRQHLLALHDGFLVSVFPWLGNKENYRTWPAV